MFFVCLHRLVGFLHEELLAFQLALRPPTRQQPSGALSFRTNMLDGSTAWNSRSLAVGVGENTWRAGAESSPYQVKK